MNTTKRPQTIEIGKQRRADRTDEPRIPTMSPEYQMKRRENNATEIAEVLAREFAQHAGAHDRDGSFPFENFDRLNAAGLGALTVACEYGGRGAGLFEA